ncbi:hypothetical protein [Qipengyuania nanhaisediminis]|uniref:hypothetical protein n=1 Tax=Qipengyuania nanhaisediminis TaxID=604088 RepID=UPI0038B2EBCA
MIPGGICIRRALFAGAATGLALALAACDGGGADGPGAVSEGEARALDEAAEMLEQRNLPEGALPPVEMPIEQAPAAQDSDNAEGGA